MNLTPEQIEELKNRPSLSRQELASRFGVTVNTITNWIHAGRFRTATGQPAVWQEKGGARQWYVLIEAVQRLEAAMELTEGKGVVNVHDVGDISVLVVEYDRETN